MTNIRPVIIKALREIYSVKSVTQTYPKDWKDFPLILVRFQHRTRFRGADKKEWHTSWTIDVEVFSTSNPYGIVEEVHDILGEMGFTGNMRDAHTDDFNRVIGRYRGVVQNDSGLVFRR